MKQPLFTTPPSSICILRLSALGDVCHVLPVVRTLQDAWPSTQITWILGKLEHKLLGHIPGIEFIVFDKKAGAQGYRDLRSAAARPAFRRVAAHAAGPAREHRVDDGAGPAPARASTAPGPAKASGCSPTPRSHARSREHVLDSLFGFAERLGVTTRSMRWDIPLPESALAYATAAIPDPARPTLVLSPCSSHALRNWSADRYAALADHAVQRHGMDVLLCGGRSPLELRVRRADRAGNAAAVPQPDRARHAARIPGDPAAGDRAGVTRFGPGAHGHDRRHAGDRAVCRRPTRSAAARITAAAGAWIATTAPRPGS